MRREGDIYSVESIRKRESQSLDVLCQYNFPHTSTFRCALLQSSLLPVIHIEPVVLDAAVMNVAMLLLCCKVAVLQFIYQLKISV
jgi:hypothetical protein